MTIHLGVVMDPIEKIHYAKDSTLALLWEAARRGWIIHYMEPEGLFLQGGKAYGLTQSLTPLKNPERWWEFQNEAVLPLCELDVILMRKDPPFNMSYIYATYLLEQAEREGVLVINKPSGIRNHNEKLFALEFPQCCPPTIVTSQKRQIQQFQQTHEDIILKPLDGMGGQGIFKVDRAGTNLNVIVDLLSHQGAQPILAQKYLPEIKAGDKRILLIDGEPIPYALARIPQGNDIRGNLAAGGRGEGRLLTERDRWICEQIGPRLREEGLLFVGIDVIGDYLTEINITSPTCIRELDQWFGLNISGVLLDVVEKLVE